MTRFCASLRMTDPQLWEFFNNLLKGKKRGAEWPRPAARQSCPRSLKVLPVFQDGLVDEFVEAADPFQFVFQL